MNSPNFVFLPGGDGKRIAVNPQQVKAVFEYDDYVHVYFSKDDGLNIKISMEDVLGILSGSVSIPLAVNPGAKGVEPRRRLMGIL